MELQEFVKETLLQITKGVKDAQEAAKEYGAVVNPKIMPGCESAQISGEYRPVQNISFEIGLTTASEDSSKKGIGVILGGLKAGYDANDGKKESAVTNIKFSIPLAFPVDASGNENKVKRRIDTISYEESKSNRFRY